MNANTGSSFNSGTTEPMSATTSGNTITVMPKKKQKIDDSATTVLRSVSEVMNAVCHQMSKPKQQNVPANETKAFCDMLYHQIMKFDEIYREDLQFEIQEVVMRYRRKTAFPSRSLFKDITHNENITRASAGNICSMACDRIENRQVVTNLSTPLSAKSVCTDIPLHSDGNRRTRVGDKIAIPPAAPNQSTKVHAMSMPAEITDVSQVENVPFYSDGNSCTMAGAITEIPPAIHNQFTPVPAMSMSAEITQAENIPFYSYDNRCSRAGDRTEITSTFPDLCSAVASGYYTVNDWQPDFFQL
jgi:hypothetical protein